MQWVWFGLGVLLTFWGGGCAGRGPGPGYGDMLAVGQREADLVARKGQPQEVQREPGGGRIYIYTTYDLEYTAAMGGGAWNRPDQEYYWLDDGGVITKVARYPYGKRKFLFPGPDKARPQPQAAAASEPSPAAVPSAVKPPEPPAETAGRAAPAEAPSRPAAAALPAPESPPKADMEAAARLELNMTREEVRRLLGAPERTEGFRAGSRSLIVWFYLLDGRQGPRVFTPLVFEDGRLSGWGEEFYRRRLRALSGSVP